jgi:hypothetical protein
MAAIVLAVGFIVPRLPGEIAGLPDRQARLPGGEALLYPRAQAAAAACDGQAVAFIVQSARTLYRAGDAGFGVWEHDQFPDRGYGCADDLQASGYRAP